MTITRTRRGIFASLTLAGAAAAVLTMGGVAHAATEPGSDKAPVVIEDTFTNPQIAEDTIAPTDSQVTQDSDLPTDPTLHQTADGAWYYQDTATEVSHGQL